MTTKFQIPDATCGHCKSTIESAVSAVPDVKPGEVSIKAVFARSSPKRDTRRTVG